MPYSKAQGFFFNQYTCVTFHTNIKPLILGNLEKWKRTKFIKITPHAAISRNSK
jgi:hypothetical protein